MSVLSRRIFLAQSLLALAGLAGGRTPAYAGVHKIFKGEAVLNRVCQEARTGNWKALPIGEVMGKVAEQLVGTQYVAGTLDQDTEREYCSVDLTALDCVTFFESTLGLARMIKKGGASPAEFMAEVTYTRYRGGKVGDYTSRLHYTTDWFYDNEKKGVIKLLNFPTSEPFTQKVGFMSANPDKYRVLAAHPELVEKMRKQENVINNRNFCKFVSQQNLPSIEKLIQTGDIVGVCTERPGIDIAHTGLVLRDKDGMTHFVDASSKPSKMKVTVEPGPISTSLHWSNVLTGAMFARPLEPK